MSCQHAGPFGVAAFDLVREYRPQTAFSLATLQRTSNDAPLPPHPCAVATCKVTPASRCK